MVSSQVSKNGSRVPKNGSLKSKLADASFSEKKMLKISKRNTYFSKDGKNLHLHHFSAHKLVSNSPIISYLNYGRDYYLVFRKDSSIEMWDADTMIKRVPGRPDAQIRKGVFVHGRLITVGLDGNIRVWTLPDFNIVQQFSSHGGAVWDICKVNNNHIAIVCEDGRARILKVVVPFLEDSILEGEKEKGVLGFSDEPDILDPVEKSRGEDTSAYVDICLLEKRSSKWDLELVKLFSPSAMDKASRHASSLNGVNRLLTVAYDQKRSRLLCGGVTGVYGFDVDSSVMMYHVQTEGFVWSISKTGEDEYAFGTSEGAVNFFEILYGTIINEFTKHNYDVTSLHLFADEGDGLSLASVGIDGQLVVYSKDSSSQWYFRSSKRPSISDLHCITTLNAKPGHLVLGGVDGHVIEYNIPKISTKERGAFSALRIDPVGGNNFTSADNLGIFAFHNNLNTVYVMYSPQFSAREVQNSSYLVRSFEYKPSVVLKLEMESFAGWCISSIAMSPNGRFLAVSTLDAVELLELSHSKDNYECQVLSRSNLRNLDIRGATSLRFITNDLLVVANRQQKIDVFHTQYMEKIAVALDGGQSKLFSYFSSHENKINGRIGSKAFNGSIQYITGDKNFLTVAYGHILSIYSVPEIVDEITKKMLKKAQNKSLSQESSGEVKIVQPKHAIPFIHGTILSLHISGGRVHVLGTKNTYTIINMEKGISVFSQGYITFDLSGTKKGSAFPKLKFVPNEKRIGCLKYAFELQKNSILLATHKEAFMYDVEKNTLTSILLDEEGVATSILALQKIGDRQLVACTIPNLYQIFELPKVVFRQRFAAM